MNPETRCALYCRVSTIGKGQDTEVQARELREFCQARCLSHDSGRAILAVAV